jgi:hypothetical protein
VRLSDLLGAEVIDESGRRVGQVHDVRLVQDGPMVATWGAAFRVDGLVVGPGSMGVRLGVHRQQGGPWLIKKLFAHRRPRLIAWSDVADVEPRHRVTLRPGAQPRDLPADY